MSVWPIRHPLPLGDSAAAQVWAAIQRAYQQMQALPGEQGKRLRRRDPAHLALEAEIRALAEEYKTLTAPRPRESQYGEPFATAGSD